jgi:hypothetical protein
MAVASAFVTLGSRVDLWNSTPADMPQFRDIPIHRPVEDKIMLSELKTRVLQQYWTHFTATPQPPEMTYVDDLKAEQGLLALRADRAMKYCESRPAALVNALRNLLTSATYDAVMAQIYNRPQLGGDGNLDRLTPLEAISLEMDAEWGREIFAKSRSRFTAEAVVQLPLSTFVSTCVQDGSSVRRVLRTVGDSLFTSANRNRIEKILNNHLVSDGIFGDREAIFTLVFARLTNVAFELFAGTDLLLSKAEAQDGLIQIMGDLADKRLIDYIFGRKRALTPVEFFELLFEHLYERLLDT